MEHEKKISQFVGLQATKQIFNNMLRNNMAVEHDYSLRCSLYLCIYEEI